MLKMTIAILGGGESGTGAAVLAAKKGYAVFVSDTGKIKENYKQVLLHHAISFEEGKHSEERIMQADEVVKSPGIPDNAPVVALLGKYGKPVISEIEFAGRFSGATKVCITGSNGKTTTSSLIYHILKRAGLRVALAGNIGKSYALQVAGEENDVHVIELSSFQLDGMFGFKADIAVLLNITPDHLDRYGYCFENYARSKFRILQNQTDRDAFIYNADDPVITDYISKTKVQAGKFPFSVRKKLSGEGAWIVNNEMIVNINSNFLNMTLENLALQGKHNIYNSMAAAIAAKILDIRKELIKESLSDFQNVEHRLEYVARIHGVDYINDSKATNVNSTWYAMESMSHPVIWIAGGIDKGNDYSALRDLAREKVRVLICLGKDNDRLIEAFGGVIDSIYETDNMPEAIKIASYLGKQNDVVLLSPACASFDLFENFEDRGNRFKEAVRSL
ncbi:MAG: UDP-N-acetylmuramoyl-L-alanine--D-glutamate ligase [Bacteroidales bacterium]|nr:UDP-N-acetylmuramoyl-L-alanine--D-glutamate ligase [Bacteroidales bacterium]